MDDQQFLLLSCWIGIKEGFDEASMCCARDAHTIWMLAYKSGFFYGEQAVPYTELLDSVASQLFGEILQ